MLEEVNSGEQNAFGMLVDLFDWLDGLQPQQIAAEQAGKTVQTRGSLAQMIGLLNKAKEKVRRGVWKVWGLLIGE